MNLSFGPLSRIQGIGETFFHKTNRTERKVKPGIGKHIGHHGGLSCSKINKI